ncbi:hypothetical protein ACQEU5_01465 [Marinactinospora thermotolerans]|uniref:Integral membrane protein n=1 Tax=Marinactinospora thermotolerans DSM 45154 TaxID=1122192 RepID=A0A1T4MC14_9ACTN|nr:hypothetical protein [Marinactinospora thermotolerans]SJZ64328.1 hypothetical protein SAMN02745673_01033 [Marinactinospora thermotolerans DSM 45154]
MDIVYSALVFLHLLGMAGIVSGWLMQLIAGHAKAPKVLLHSSLLQLATGLLLVGVAEMGDGDLNHMKIGVKLVVAFAVAVLGVVNLRKPSTGLATAAGVLTLVNVAVAVFW